MLEKKMILFSYTVKKDEPPVEQMKEAMIDSDGTRLVLIGTWPGGGAFFVFEDRLISFEFEAIQTLSDNGSVDWMVLLGAGLRKNAASVQLSLDDIHVIARRIEAALRHWDGYPNRGPVSQVTFRVTEWQGWDPKRGDLL